MAVVCQPSYDPDAQLGAGLRRGVVGLVGGVAAAVQGKQQNNRNHGQQTLTRGSIATIASLRIVITTAAVSAQEWACFFFARARATH